MDCSIKRTCVSPRHYTNPPPEGACARARSCRHRLFVLQIYLPVVTNNLLDMRLHIVARTGIRVVHNTSVGKMVDISLYHTIGSMICRS